MIRTACLIVGIGQAVLFGGSALGGEPEALVGGAYAARTAAALRAAEKTIVVSMYRMEEDAAEPRVLIDELLAAKARGVAVQVYLDREERGGGFNGPAGAFLEERGIPVFWDDPRRMFHVKAVVVDGEWVVSGSHNWTRAGLLENAEVSTVLRSEKIAAELLSYLSSLSWTRGPLAAEAQETAPIEVSFLVDKARLGRMVGARAEDALDLYLWLRSYLDAGRLFELDYNAAALALGFSGRMDETAYRRRLNKLLGALEKRYGLIEFEPRHAQEARVVILDLPDAEGIFPFPIDYWRFRWRDELSLTAKASLLVALCEEAVESKGPSGFWSRPQRELARTFGVWEGTLSAGFETLARKGVLEIRYRWRRTPAGIRTRARYRLKRLYDPAELRAKFQKLEEAHGNKRVEEARRWAACVLKENDPQAVGLLLKETQGESAPALKEARGRMEQAVKIVASKARQNPKRRFGYLVATYRRL